MKHTVLLVIALLFGQASTHADEIKKAVTEQGDVVVLMPDGTWYYQDGSVKQPMTIAVNDAPFSKSKDATFLIKSSINNSAVWINPKQWKFKRTIMAMMWLNLCLKCQVKTSMRYLLMKA